MNRDNGDEVVIYSVVASPGGHFTVVEWRVSRDTLEKQPRWDGFSSEAPLSAAKACTLALPRVKQRFPEVKEWSIASVNLANLLRMPGYNSYPDIWCYRIHFTPKGKDSEARHSFTEKDELFSCNQVVLLDGTVVSSTIVTHAK